MATGLWLYVRFGGWLLLPLAGYVTLQTASYATGVACLGVALIVGYTIGTDYERHVPDAVKPARLSHLFP